LGETNIGILVPWLDCMEYVQKYIALSASVVSFGASYRV
jgi:hypothetical protein